MASNPMTPVQLAEIREREAKATAGPWRSNHGRHTVLDKGHKKYISKRTGYVPEPHTMGDGETGYMTTDDADFIAHARTDIPALLAALDAAASLAKEIENHCPCGARPESPRTHPHVTGCPVYKLLRVLGVPRP